MISSPFFVENVKKSQAVQTPHQACRAIQYYLEKVLPKGGVACVFYPKELSEAILVKAAKDKRCRIKCVGGSKEFLTQLQTEGLLEVRDVPVDIFLVEPVGFGKHGVWVRPEESAELAGAPLVAIASVMQWTDAVPKDYDLVSVKRVVSDQGVYDDAALLLEEVQSTLPWLMF